MTRRDFELIARAVRNAGGSRNFAEALARELVTTSPRFDRERFIAACTRQEPS